MKDYIYTKYKDGKFNMLIKIYEKFIINNPRYLIELGGCNSFVFYNKLEKRRILLIGESHQLKNNCNNEAYTVDRWLADLSLN